MYALAINGSPRKGGNTEHLLKTVLSEFIGIWGWAMIEGTCLKMRKAWQTCVILEKVLIGLPGPLNPIWPVIQSDPRPERCLESGSTNRSIDGESAAKKEIMK